MSTIDSLTLTITAMYARCDTMYGVCDDACRECPYNPHYTDNVLKYLKGERRKD